MDVYEKLKSCGIGITKPRVAILEYLMTQYTHPTVDDIYRNLVVKIPTLSRTTVYNVVKLFTEHGLVNTLGIDERNVCVDGDTVPHGHFFCKECGRIIDVPLTGLSAEGLDGSGNMVTEVHLYYKGVCSECMSRKKTADSPL
ncbi:MAG: transcriptional repressor [Bacteroides sp.]|nr:transcriptional repressor [Roseburia sp.]MCM1347077.1 transcriptional repressor [Bacteroides sp.]MCM1420540.1 transcriptional repressor [Bacteroides sp.]